MRCLHWWSLTRRNAVLSSWAQEQSTTAKPPAVIISRSVSGERTDVAVGVSTIPPKPSFIRSNRTRPNRTNFRPEQRRGSHCSKSHMAVTIRPDDVSSMVKTTKTGYADSTKLTSIGCPTFVLTTHNTTRSRTLLFDFTLWFSFTFHNKVWLEKNWEDCVCD